MMDMLSGMQEMQRLKDKAADEGRVVAFSAVARDGRVLAVYADGEVSGFPAAMIVNSIPHLYFGRRMWTNSPAASAGGDGSDDQGSALKALRLLPLPASILRRYAEERLRERFRLIGGLKSLGRLLGLSWSRPVAQCRPPQS